MKKNDQNFNESAPSVFYNIPSALFPSRSPLHREPTSVFYNIPSAPDLPALENRKAVLARAPQSILFQGIEITPINLAMLGFVWDRRRKMRD
jgi:hypothetical protein